MLRNYAPPGGVVPSAPLSTPTPVSTQTQTLTTPPAPSTPTTPMTATTATTTSTTIPPTQTPQTPPTPPLTQYGSPLPLPIPPASRSSSDSDIAGAGGVGVGVGVVGGHWQYATLVDWDENADAGGGKEGDGGVRKEHGAREGGGRDGRFTYVALLARWCFHTSGPGGAGDDATPAPQAQQGDGHSQMHSHYFTTPGPSALSPSSTSTPRSAGSSASSFFASAPSPSAALPLTSPHTHALTSTSSPHTHALTSPLTSTPRTGSLDDMRALYERHHSHEVHYWTRRFGEAYGSDPGQGSGGLDGVRDGVGSGYGHGHGHGRTGCAVSFQLELMGVWGFRAFV
ncbi:hypothetical protein K439DRAFT_986911 [Ramaria rubella]|nr:hypothetical protein K439DRAFT_986911 [Ramaria rubella]